MARRTNRRRWLIWTVLVIVIVFAGWWMFGHPKSAGVSYRTVSVERGDLVSKVSSTGALEPVTTVSVGTQVSGQIGALYADYNDHVHEGQLLARLDTTVLQAAVEDAQSAVDRAQAQLDTAQLEYQRQTALHAQGVASQNDLDQAQEALKVARASRVSARTGLERAQRNLGYATIRSPIDGVVISRLVDVGQTVAASLQAPELFQIAADLTRMQILASVDESDVGQVHTGQNVEFRVQAWPDRVFNGKVRQIRLQPVTQDNVVTYTAVIDVDNSDNTLLPGMTATVDFLVAEAHDVMKVANAALRFRPTESMWTELRKQRRAAMGAESENSDRRPGPPTGAMRGQRPSANGGRAGFSHNGSPFSERSDRALLWTLDASGRVRPVPVKTGITDGQETEVAADGIQEGTTVIVAVTEGETATLRNPFQQEQNGRRRRPPGIGF